LIKHGPHWRKIIVLTFISENNRCFKGLYKNWNKINSIDMKKNGEIEDKSWGNEERGEFGSL
jgi:hypothetical protein